ncbi:MAG: hypothetical protein ACLFQV_03765 [Vulcanimicrobiota bacterium]
MTDYISKSIYCPASDQSWYSIAAGYWMGGKVMSIRHTNVCDPHSQIIEEITCCGSGNGPCYKICEFHYCTCDGPEPNSCCPNQWWPVGVNN